MAENHISDPQPGEHAFEEMLFETERLVLQFDPDAVVRLRKFWSQITPLTQFDGNLETIQRRRRWLLFDPGVAELRKCCLVEIVDLYPCESGTVLDKQVGRRSRSHRHV